MLPTIIEFAAVTLGAKFLLGVVFIYYLLPADHTCEACDGETVPLRAWWGLRRVARWCGLERRWCPRCGSTVVVRRSKGAARPRFSVTPTAERAGQGG